MVIYCDYLFACISPSFPTATPRPPSSSAKVGGKQENSPAHRGQSFHWPQEKIETFRRLLRDEPLISPHDLFTTQKTVPHGQVQAILEMIDRLQLDHLISAQRCRERDFSDGHDRSALDRSLLEIGNHREWHTTTLAEELGVAEATENDLYEAMDWLLERQERIEKKLAARHLSEGGLVLYDVSVVL